jgi:hypothetical protein
VTRNYRKEKCGDPHPTPEVFLRVLQNNVLKELGANKKDDIVKLPMFMEYYRYPKGAVYF